MNLIDSSKKRVEFWALLRSAASLENSTNPAWQYASNISSEFRKVERGCVHRLNRASLDQPKGGSEIERNKRRMKTKSYATEKKRNRRRAIGEMMKLGASQFQRFIAEDTRQTVTIPEISSEKQFGRSEFFLLSRFRKKSDLFNR
jgi:hypothetical protein